MKKNIQSILALVVLLVPKLLIAQTNPIPFDLSGGNFSFSQWDATTAAGTYPTNMRFWCISATTLNDITFATTEPTLDYDVNYNRTSGTRITGLGTNGISFLHTGTAITTPAPTRFVSSAVVGLNTLGRANVTVNWNGGTVFVAPRNYALILEYRIGNTGAWNIATGSGGITDTIQYKSNATAGHLQTMPTFTLPSSCENQPNVQLRWRYYQWSAAASGARPELRLDDIVISSQVNAGIPTKLVVTSVNPSIPSTNTPFSLTVQAQNNDGLVKAVQVATSFNISLQTGLGVLSGNLVGTIPVGQSQVTVSGILYSTQDANVVLRVTRTSGDILAFGDSPTFSVLSAASNLVFTSTPVNVYANDVVPAFIVTARRLDLTTDNNFPSSISLSVLSGPGTISGTTNKQPINGSVSFNDIVFSAPGVYALRAASTNVSDGVSSQINVVVKPTMQELKTPQYMLSNASSSARIPTHALVRLQNLQPNTAYRYFVSGASNLTVLNPTFDGAGSNINYNANTNQFNFTSNRSLTTAGQYSQFTTGANETSKTLWINIFNSTNAQFNNGANVTWIVQLVDTSKSLTARLFSTNTTKTIRLQPTTTSPSNQEAIGIVDSLSGLQAKTVICLYDDATGASSPISTALVQDDETTVIGAVSFYTNLDAVASSWATIIPNNLPNGIRRIEQRSLITGEILKVWVDDDGNWSGSNTVNASTSNWTIPMGIRIPQIIVDETITNSTFCTSAPILIKYQARGVDKVNVEISYDGGANYALLTTNYSSTAGVYTLTPNSLMIGNSNLRIRLTDSERASVVAITGIFSVNSPAQITKQPLSQTACTNGTLSAVVEASGSNLTYQWQKNGANLVGFTNPSITLTNVVERSMGEYRCVVGGARGCSGAVSNTILFRVQPALEITDQPKNVVSVLGGKAMFMVEVNNSNSTYQWKRGTSNVVESDRITGTKTPMLSVKNIQAQDIGNWYCVVTSACGVVTTLQAHLSVSTLAIDSHPQTTSACVGSNATFSIVVNSSSNVQLSYVWKFKGNTISNNSKYSGATTSTLMINNVDTFDVGDYTCVVSANNGASATSNIASLTISSSPLVQNVNMNVNLCAGENFTLTGETNVTNVQYQWLFNGSTVAGENQRAISKTASAGKYTLVVWNDCGSDTSDVATIVIKKATEITLQPRSNVLLIEGSNLVLNTESEGSGTLTYQWYFNGTAIAGQTNATLNIPNVTLANFGSYKLVVKGDCGSDTSSTSIVSNATSVESETLAGERISVEQNTPNPFASKTSIEFNLPFATEISIEISDLLGNKVATENLGNLEAGKHIYTFNSSTLANGVYTYTITNGRTHSSKLMTIVK